MKLSPSPKNYIAGTHRIVPPEETLKIADAARALAGITRVADITGLDRLGIPIFTSIRPTAAIGAVTVYTGKGFTEKEAEVSAIMEAIERYSAEPDRERIKSGSYRELKRRMNLLDPRDLIIPPLKSYSEDDIIEWVDGFSIVSGKERYVPAEAAFHPYSRRNQLFRTNTNGLAVGNSKEEAIYHAMMEVIERDAWSLFEAGKISGREINLSPDALSKFPMVKALVTKMRSSGIKVFAKDITSDVGVPTVAAAIDDELTRDPALLSLGVGTHLMPEIAAVRALTEAAQSRLTTIHGTREDTLKAEFARRIGYERMKRINKRWFEPSGEAVTLDQLKSYISPDFLDDIIYTLEALSKAALNEVIVVDLTKKGLGVPAVRVIIPGMEVYSLDKERAGERLRNYGGRT